MVVPQTLDDWNLEIIEKIVDSRIPELDFFDFKKQLPHSKDEEGKKRLRKEICAFANSSGGFLIFGVSDASQLSGGESLRNRIIGMKADEEFPSKFGSYPKDCSPSVSWQPKVQPISLKNNQVIQIIQIERSWNSPHAVRENEVLHFVKRTHKGVEYMSLEEIRFTMLNQHEKRLKIELVRGEIANIMEESNFIPIRETFVGKHRYKAPKYDVNVIESVLSEIYTILKNHNDIILLINKIRKKCKTIEEYVNKMNGVEFLFGFNQNSFDGHNHIVGEGSEEIHRNCQECIDLIDKFLNS
jgi:predicted HTH transcriptional regulator